MIKTIAFDGDDTLWDHQPYFDKALDAFKQVLSHYTDKTGIRDHADDVHIRNLNIYGYGVEGFTISMVESAIELTDQKISAAHIHDIIAIGRDILDHPIDLLKGVEDCIKSLCDQNQHNLMIITKGELFAQENKIARSGLAQYMDHIEIVSEKNVATYNKIFKSYQILPGEFLMVGNSIRSDILPVLECGAHAVHVPYHTSWKFEEAEIATTEHEQRFHIIQSMAHLSDFLQGIETW